MSPPLPDGDEQLSASLAAAAGMVGGFPGMLDQYGSVQDQNQNQHQDQQQLHEPVHEDHVPVADVVANDNPQLEAAAVAALKPDGAEEGETADAAKTAAKLKRCRKATLTPHEALMFAPRGIYVDIAGTGQLRCSCNHKVCEKWDQHGYARHFTFKVHQKYENERLDDAEIVRLKEAKKEYLRMNPIIEEPSIRRKRKMREGEKILSVDELRVQERHWMEMWRDAKNELKELRRELRGETDEEIRAELQQDIQGLKKRKEDWARLLGLNEAPVDFTVTF